MHFQQRLGSVVEHPQQVRPNTSMPEAFFDRLRFFIVSEFTTEPAGLWRDPRRSAACVARAASAMESPPGVPRHPRLGGQRAGPCHGDSIAAGGFCRCTLRQARSRSAHDVRTGAKERTGIRTARQDYCRGRPGTRDAGRSHGAAHRAFGLLADDVRQRVSQAPTSYCASKQLE